MSDYTSTAPTTTAITLTEAKAQLNVSSTADDTLITQQLKAATLYLETKTRRCFVRQTRTLKADDFFDSRYVHNRRLYPGRSPLSSVTSLTYVASNGTTTTMPSSDYVVSTGDQPGYIAEAYDATWPACRAQPNAVTLTYVAGHVAATSTGGTASSQMPENIKQAIMMVVGHWYRNRESVVTGMPSKEIEMGVDALLESEMTEGYA